MMTCRCAASPPNDAGSLADSANDVTGGPCIACQTQLLRFLDLTPCGRLLQQRGATCQRLQLLSAHLSC